MAAGHLYLAGTSAHTALAPTRLTSSLREALGPPAAEDLLTIVDEMRAEHASFRAEFAEFRREMQARFDAIDARFDRLESRFASQFDRVESQFDRVDQRFQALDTRVGDVKADLMKWSFVFWVGAVTAIAVLAGVLDR